MVASYDLLPGNGAGPIFWKVRDRRRNRREGKTHKKGRRKNTNRKGKQNKNTNKSHSHSAEINKWIVGTNYPLTYGPGARTGRRGQALCTKVVSATSSDDVLVIKKCHTKSSTRQNSGVLRVFSGNAGAFTRISSVSGGKFLMKKYLHTTITHSHQYQHQREQQEGRHPLTRQRAANFRLPANQWAECRLVTQWRHGCRTMRRSVCNCGLFSLRSDIKGMELPPANILIPLDRQLIAIQLCRWEFLYNETFQQTFRPLFLKLSKRQQI